MITMLLEKFDPAVFATIKEKREDGTLALAAASLIALGIGLGAVAIYDRVVESRKQDAK